MSQKVEATLETRVSQKGKEYQVIVIRLTDTYEKLVFLEKAELELIKAQSKDTAFDFPNLN